MRMVWAGCVLLAAAGCAMQPARSGPWPPLPATLPQAAAPAASAMELFSATAPEPAPLAAPISLLPAWPQGWRAPSDEELNGTHAVHRGDSASAYLSAEGDFNGDGAADRAVLLVSDARNQYGVFVFDGRPGAYPVLVGGPAASVEALGLAPAAEGRVAFFLFGSSRFEIVWDGTAYAVTVVSD